MTYYKKRALGHRVIKKGRCDAGLRLIELHLCVKAAVGKEGDFVGLRWLVWKICIGTNLFYKAVTWL